MHDLQSRWQCQVSESDSGGKLNASASGWKHADSRNERFRARGASHCKGNCQAGERHDEAPGAMHIIEPPNSLQEEVPFQIRNRTADNIDTAPDQCSNQNLGGAEGYDG